MSVFAAEDTPANDAAIVDLDNVPRPIGGPDNRPVIPYALPEIPMDVEVGKKTPWGHPDISGIYAHELRDWYNPWPSRGVGPGLFGPPTGLTIHPLDVTDSIAHMGDYRTPLLRPWAAELVKRYGDTYAAGQAYFQLCLQNAGLLRSWSRIARGLQILQTPDHVYLFFGQDITRIIHLNTGHPADLELSYNGHSVGHWEGNTLVVDTVGFDGTAWADRYATPTTERMHVVEYISLRHGDQVLEANFLVDDPLVYTQPWRSVVTHPRTEKLGVERVCREYRIYE